MLTAAIELKFAGQIVEPGMPIPADHGMAHHILQAHLNRRLILECDEKRANEIRTKFLKDKLDAEERTLKSTLTRLQADVDAAKREVDKEAAEARAAESRLAAIASARRSAETKAQGRLAELNRQLAELSGRKAPEPAAPVAAAPVAPPPSATHYSRTALKKMSAGELKLAAAELNIAGAEEASKSELIEAILASQPEEN
jgi:hypothetical protein